MKPTLRVSVAPWSILLVLGVIGIILFLDHIVPVLISIYVAFIIMAAMHPLDTWLIKRGISKPASHLLGLILSLALVLTLLGIIVPPMVNEIMILFGSLQVPPQIMTGLTSLRWELADLPTLTSPIGWFGGLLGTVLAIINVPLQFLIVLFLGYYLLVERQRLWRFGSFLGISKDYGKVVRTTIDRVEEELGNWIIAELILMAAIGVMAFIGLSIMGIPFALVLAVFAGLMEILPNIGPVISIIPALAAAASTGNFNLLIGVGILFVIIHQLENNLIVPMVMKHSVGLSPIITIPLLLIGDKLGGALGAILIVPLALSLKIVIMTGYTTFTASRSDSVST